MCCTYIYTEAGGAGRSRGLHQLWLTLYLSAVAHVQIAQSMRHIPRRTARINSVTLISAVVKLQAEYGDSSRSRPAAAEI